MGKKSQTEHGNLVCYLERIKVVNRPDALSEGLCNLAQPCQCLSMQYPPCYCHNNSQSGFWKIVVESGATKIFWEKNLNMT